MPKSKLVDPAKVVSPDVYKRTLKAVNILLRKGKKPTLKKLPSGIPDDPCMCPVAKALRPLGRNEVDGGGITIYLTRTTVSTVRKTPFGKTVETEILSEDEFVISSFDTDPTLAAVAATVGEFVTAFDND
jgi:hypothetical protein